MCHDISFSANTVEFITEIIPNAILDGQMLVDFSVTSHVLSMSHRKCLVVINPDGQPKICQFEWGLIASYMDTPDKIKQYRIQMANARSEKVFDKASAWYRLRKQRCLIAVEGIYEHREIKGWKNKVPYYIRLKHSKQMLLPGFYSYSPIPNPETGELVGTFTIVTRAANEVMRQIHNHGPNKHRMPVFMRPEDVVKWIDPELSDAEMQTMLNYEIESEELLVHPVFTVRTTKERPDGKNRQEEYSWVNLPPLGIDTPLTNELF